MKLFLFILVSFPIFSTEIKEKNLNVKEGKILFSSNKDEEMIKGIGKLAFGKILFQDKKFLVKFDLKDFKTTNFLQTKHLHDNYLETEQFPDSVYEGEIKSYDPKTGETELIGIMRIHGESKKDFFTKGKLTRSKENYLYESEFQINLKDFKIEIPKLLILKINEIIQVKTNFILVGAEWKYFYFF